VTAQLDSTTEELHTEDLDTESALDYIERFNELLDNKEYDMAAVHAANSPQGILRTAETLHRLSGTTCSYRMLVTLCA